MKETTIEKALRCLARQHHTRADRFAPQLEALQAQGGIEKFTAPELTLALELMLRRIPVKHHVRLGCGHWEADLFIDFGGENECSSGIDIECDGDFWHSPRNVRLKDRRRDIDLARWRVLTLRVKESDIIGQVIGCGELVQRVYKVVCERPEMLLRPNSLIRVADEIRLRQKKFGLSKGLDAV